MILVKGHLEAWSPNPELVPGRPCQCFVQHGELGILNVFCAYLYDSEGLSPRNIGILEAFGTAAAKMGSPYVLAGDVN
eukprot:3532736-Pyramimonas_sp.AAC.1